MRNTIFLIALLLTAACRHQQHPRGLTLSDPFEISSGAAGGAYFTFDNQGNNVLCWTSGSNGEHQLHYAIYNRKTRLFEKPVAVPSKGISLSPETMNKIAFREDGSVVAVFSRKQPTDNNKYAGSLIFLQSFDEGRTWTSEKFIHTDTLPDNSRSYFDLATLPDGEVGVVWLDGRLKKGKNGSSLFFTKTNGRNGFQADQLLSETVCQCCRTDIFVDKKGKIHIAYRDIEQTVKGQLRDFAHIVSSDNGLTFSSPNKISNDNWIVDGCPHTGASMGGGPGDIEIVWFTGGDVPGLYFSESYDDGKTFRSRSLVSERGRHPQMAAWKTGTLIAWQEAGTVQNASAHHDHHDSEPGRDAVVLELRKDNGVVKYHVDDPGEYPVVATVDEEHGLIAYTRNDKIVVRGIQY